MIATAESLPLPLRFLLLALVYACLSMLALKISRVLLRVAGYTPETGMWSRTLLTGLAAAAAVLVLEVLLDVRNITSYSEFRTVSRLFHFGCMALIAFIHYRLLRDADESEKAGSSTLLVCLASLQLLFIPVAKMMFPWQHWKWEAPSQWVTQQPGPGKN